MKRHFNIYMAVAALSAGIMLCTGCMPSSKSSVERSTGEVTAVHVIPTEAPTPETTETYSDYSTFAEEYSEKHPDAFELPVPEDKLSEVKGITLSGSRYVLDCENEAGQQAEVIVEHAKNGCESIHGLIIAQGNVDGSKITERTDDFFIRSYDSGRMELTMLKGDNNTVCTIAVDGDSTPEEKRELLLVYKKRLGM